MQTIGQIWTDYQPQSFIEDHQYILQRGEFGSINLVQTLWENGRTVDAFTLFLESRDDKKRVHRTLLTRIMDRLFRSRRWTAFQDFCAEKIKEKQISLLHFHFGTTAAAFLPVLERVKLPGLVTFYGVDASAALRDPATRENYKVLSQKGLRFLVLCEAVRQRMIAIGCVPERITVWNMPAGIEKYPYAPRSPGAEVRFLIGARFTEKKGHFILLEAFQKFLSSGKKAKLSMIGYGPDKQKILDRANELNLTEHIRLIDTASIPDFASYFNQELIQHDIFVLPSTTAQNGDDEGGPALTLVSAQAAGLPVICTPFPGAEISIRDKECGFICRDQDPADLAEKMLSLASQPELWNVYGKRGSEIVNREFSEKGQMEKLMAIYRELLQS